MSSKSELYYLKDIRTGKYHGPNGLVESKEKATQFSEIQLKTRLGVPKTYTNVFKEKLANSGMTMEIASKHEIFFRIKSSIKYNDDNILFCDGKFYFEGGFLKKKVVYCPIRNSLRIPELKGEYLGCELTVLDVVGEINPD